MMHPIIERMLADFDRLNPKGQQAQAPKTTKQPAKPAEKRDDDREER